jgi:hypothetical protein
MKVTIKPKVESTDQFNISLPLSLKQRLQTLKAQAPEHDADFNGTLVGVLEEFATELEARFNSPGKTSRTNPRKSLGHATPPAYGNGTDPE